MSELPKLSTNLERAQKYGAFLELCPANKGTVQDLIHLGDKLMHKQGLYHHFVADHDNSEEFSLFANAKALAHFALNKHTPNNSKSDQDHVTTEEAIAVLTLFERRISERIPVEYITNEALYMGRTFYVNEHVLVPRSLMSMRFQDFLDQVSWKKDRVLDLCTGSGCIGITLALMKPTLHVDLADISPKALDVARINIKKYSLEERVRCRQSDCFENIQEKYDLIITNPPYVATSDYKKSPLEFLNEPRGALESGKDGLDIINRILSQAKSHLNPDGLLIAEVGIPAAKLLKKKYPRVRFEWFKYRKPNGRESFFNDDSVFLCRYAELENI